MQFARQHKNRFVEPFNQLRFKRILSMMPHSNGGKILDVGCANGTVCRVLSQSCETVGVDVEKGWFRNNGKNDKLDYVAGDINALPFADGSFDLIVCTSVLEHMLTLDPVLKKLQAVLKQNGIVIAGYPVETLLFKFIWKLISPDEFKLIDQKHPEKVKNFWNYPGSHKQTYSSIRKAINKHFRLCQHVKLPFSFLPDWLSYYECLQLSKD